MNDTRVAEFDSADDALRFARMKGPDYTVCGGIRFMYAVRPKSRLEIGAGASESPPESLVDEDEFYEDNES
jgi:hypothetical protein